VILRRSHLLTLVLLACSCTSYAAPTQEQLQQARDGDSAVQLSVAREYLSENKTKQAHYWLVNALLNGNQDALPLMGQLFEQQANQPLSSLTLAENWYQVGSEAGNPLSDDAYARVLEQQFNLRRAKQVSAINLLDQAADATLADEQISRTLNEATSNKIRSEYIAITLLVALILSGVMIRRRLRNRRIDQQIDQSGKLADKDKEIKALQSSLNKTFEQIKRQQYLQQKQGKEQSFTLACALFGFNPRKLPDERTIKLRYKKLSRIYHPDANGSDEEMKRLNAAFRVITAGKK
jgi:hypothetical protein